MALSTPKKTTMGTGRGLVSLGVIAAAACLQGGMALISAGLARPARAGQGANDLAKINDVASDAVLGVFVESVTGGGSDGAKSVAAQAGELLCKNSAGVDAITVADIGRHCFVVDDETVARTSAGGTRPRAGVVMLVDSAGVMVAMGPREAAVPPRELHLPFTIPATELGAGTAIELVSPVAGHISRATGIVQTAIVTGGDVTALVDTTAVDGLALTFADAAAKGAVITDTPTAGHASTVVAAGQRIQLLPGAAFNGGGAIAGVLTIAY